MYSLLRAMMILSWVQKQNQSFASHRNQHIPTYHSLESQEIVALEIFKNVVHRLQCSSPVSHHGILKHHRITMLPHIQWPVITRLCVTRRKRRLASKCHCESSALHHVSKFEVYSKWNILCFFVWYRFDKTVRYASRKARADVRRRVKGRFVKAGEAYDYDPLTPTRSYWRVNKVDTHGLKLNKGWFLTYGETSQSQKLWKKNKTTLWGLRRH